MSNAYAFQVEGSNEYTCQLYGLADSIAVGSSGDSDNHIRWQTDGISVQNGVGVAPSVAPNSFHGVRLMTQGTYGFAFQFETLVEEFAETDREAQLIPFFDITEAKTGTIVERVTGTTLFMQSIGEGNGHDMINLNFNASRRLEPPAGGLIVCVGVAMRTAFDDNLLTFPANPTALLHVQKLFYYGQQVLGVYT